MQEPAFKGLVHRTVNGTESKQQPGFMVDLRTCKREEFTGEKND
jgi:hypothetical protein